MDTQPDQEEVSVEGAAPPTAQMRMPRDICEWVKPGDVICWVREELAAMSGAEAPSAQPTGVFADPMLAVLAFAYTRSIFDSDEIAQLCHSDPLFRELSRKSPISGSELKSFRHRDRGLLVKLIFQLLVKAARQRFGLTSLALPPELRRAAQDSAVERLDSARHLDRGDEV